MKINVKFFLALYILFACLPFMMQAELKAVETSSPIIPFKEKSYLDLKDRKPFTISLREDQKGYVVLFLSSICPCSISHLDHLEKLQHDFPDFLFVGVHSDQITNQEEVHQFFKERKLKFPILQDKSAEIADKLGALKTPHIFILDKEGKKLFQGGITDSHDFKRAKVLHLKNALTQIHEGKAASPNETKVIGCLIER